MSFRTKVLLSISLTVLLAVWLVAFAASTILTRSFEERETRRTAAVLARFNREFDRRGADVARRIDAIATSDRIARIALDPANSALYVNDAQTIAQEQSLDLLEIVGPDGAIVSSAQWPARFGYKESWLLDLTDWKSQPVFLKREDLADTNILGLIAVRTVKTGDAVVYVAGGQKLDKEFLDSLPLPDAMQAELYLPSPPPSSAVLVVGPQAREVSVLLYQVSNDKTQHTRTTREATLSAIPLLGRDRQLLSMLLITSSHAELLSMKADLRNTALAVAGAGLLFGIALSFWTASRVTRPVTRLAASVREVAAGHWDTRAEARSSDEIGQLARDFNHMTQQLVEQRDRMIQAERVAAWRELARRLAHELKNPLFPIQLTIENLQRAREHPHFDEIFRESTTTLLDELQNLKTIVGRFSDFAKMPAPQLERVDLNEIARHVVQLFDAQLHAPGRAPVEPVLDLEENPPAIFADPEQVRRVLQNLVLNALDAMPEGGSLTVRSRSTPDKVTLEVSDSGEGLTPEECERLFTPYYTTKRHGTGLGLAIVQSVVSDHHGSISVHSEPGRGATFRIELPTCPASS